MTGAWRGGLQVTNAVDIATDAVNSLGPSVNSASSTFTKGPWTQLVASATIDSTWIMVYLQTMIGVSGTIAVDIGIGGSGSEQAIITNLLASSTAAVGMRFLFPVAIKAGTRIVARESSGSASDRTVIGVTTFADTYGSVGVGSGVDTYGAIATTNLGTAVDPGGTANTKGAYIQLSASLTSDISGFLLLFDAQAQLSGSVGGVSWLIDLAVGAAGSEKIILPNLFVMGVMNTGAFSEILHSVIPYIPLQIRTGTRLAIRAQCSTNTSPDRIFGVTFYGIRQ